MTTVALKGSPICESVLVNVSSRRMRRATSCGTWKDCAATSAGRPAKERSARKMAARRESTEQDERSFIGDDLSCFRIASLWGLRNPPLSGCSSQERLGCRACVTGSERDTCVDGGGRKILWLRCPRWCCGQLRSE